VLGEAGFEAARPLQTEDKNGVATPAIVAERKNWRRDQDRARTVWNLAGTSAAEERDLPVMTKV
jgi:hypothetical protein